MPERIGEYNGNKILIVPDDEAEIGNLEDLTALHFRGTPQHDICFEFGGPVRFGEVGIWPFPAFKPLTESTPLTSLTIPAKPTLDRAVRIARDAGKRYRAKARWDKELREFRIYLEPRENQKDP